MVKTRQIVDQLRVSHLHSCINDVCYIEGYNPKIPLSIFAWLGIADRPDPSAFWAATPCTKHIKLSNHHNPGHKTSTSPQALSMAGIWSGQIIHSCQLRNMQFFPWFPFTSIKMVLLPGLGLSKSIPTRGVSSRRRRFPQCGSLDCRVQWSIIQAEVVNHGKGCGQLNK